MLSNQFLSLVAVTIKVDEFVTDGNIPRALSHVQYYKYFRLTDGPHLKCFAFNNGQDI